MKKLTLRLVLNLIFILPGTLWGQQKDYSFSRAFADKVPVTTLGGVRFPRQQLNYRGQEAALYSLRPTLAAFLGLNQGILESPTFSAIKLSLMGRFNQSQYNKLRISVCGMRAQAPACPTFDKRFVDSETSFNEAITDALRNHKGYFDENAAIQKTRDLMNQYFFNLQKEEVSKYFLDYRSLSHYPTEVLFSSYYTEVASIYGDAVVVFEDKLRGLDLNYYNSLLGSSWITGADAGEAVYPGYLTPQQILGIELHARGTYPNRLNEHVRISVYMIQGSQPIEVAIYKLEVKGEVFALVFDSTMSAGHKSKCIRPVNLSAGQIFFCDLAGGGSLPAGNAPLGRTLPEIPGLMGVIQFCSTVNCAKPDHVFNLFPSKSRRKLEDVQLKNAAGIGHENLLMTIKNTQFSVGGKTLRSIYWPTH